MKHKPVQSAQVAQVSWMLILSMDGNNNRRKSARGTVDIVLQNNAIPMCPQTQQGKYKASAQGGLWV